jgi:hypothetical protein
MDAHVTMASNDASRMYVCVRDVYNSRILTANIENGTISLKYYKIFEHNIILGFKFAIYFTARSTRCLPTSFLKCTILK